MDGLKQHQRHKQDRAYYVKILQEAAIQECCQMTKKVFILQLAQRISSFFPALKKEIKIAHLKTSPQQFIYDNIKFSLPFSLGLTVLFFFIVDKANLPIVLLHIAFLFLF